MRTGSCSVQQGLTSEAASIVKQAVTLAKRRGHAQVTPLHVANTLLSVSNGLLRRACLQSHSHPLQCKALELCFNVALNRLPASPSSSSSSSTMLGPHHQYYSQCPSISNALVAAFKRAQAHQRRGSIENPQQQLLAVKIELEQLVISILDDPSVSRVMREAGFSSTQVKSNVEQVVSLEICAQNNNNNNNKSSKENSSNTNLTSTRESSSMGNKTTSLMSDPIREEDVASVIDNMGKQRRKSIVILGESLASVEGVVRGVMDKIDKGEVCESLRGVKFVSLSLSGFSHVSRVEVEQKIEELRILVQSSSNDNSRGGYVLYLGDLKWVFEYSGRRSNHGKNGGGCNNYYCAVDHMVMEIGKLVSGVGEYRGRFWIMGIATFRDYMRCKNGHPSSSSSLEAVWGLHPITIPAGTLRLCLLTDHSDSQNQSGSKKADDHNGSSGNTCNSDSSCRSSLPTWLQQCKDERKAAPSNNQHCVQVGDLCKKWNSMCGSVVEQQLPYQALVFSSASPPSSGFSHERSVIELTQSQRDHHHTWISETPRNPIEPTLRIYIPENNNHTNRSFFSPSNPDSIHIPNSTFSRDAAMGADYSGRFKELNSENMKTLCNALEEKVPWQKDIIPEIVSTLLQCRSGMLKRKGKSRNNNDSNSKEETWLFFQGVDIEAKERIARELARLVFGCESNNLVTIALSSFSSSSSFSNEDCRYKRSRDKASCSYIDRFADAVSCNPHRVFLVEDIEQADYFSHVGFHRAIESGSVKDSNGEQVSLCDAIIILSCESFSSRSSRCSSPSNKQKSREGSQEENIINGDVANLKEVDPPCVSLDLNICIDDHDQDHQSVDDVGLLESVDRKIVFKIQEL